MEITLSPNIERMLRLKIAEGLYDSLNEAINATLNIALNGNSITEERLNMLKDDIQKGLTQADAGKLDDAYDFINELKAKYE